MKKIIPFFALIILCLYSCKKDNQKVAIPQKNVPISERPIPTLPNSNVNKGVVNGGAHYICPNSCQGGTSNAKGTCPVCSTQLAHNQGFHAAPSSNTNTSTTNPAPVKSSGPNAAGEYHYICTNGCSGGADAKESCSNCSAELAHNTAYHNN